MLLQVSVPRLIGNGTPTLGTDLAHCPRMIDHHYSRMQ